MTSAATIMAWNWVIQSIARFKQVDSPILAGIVKKAPAITDDDLGKDAREIVSLRILESLFLHGDEGNIVTDSAGTAKICFDPSEHCEDILHNILKETSEPMTELEKEKWNVRPFILHKRGNVLKSPLQKFKEALVEGSHPLLASLKERCKLGGEILSDNAKVDVNFDAQNTADKNDLVSWNPANKKAKIQESLLNFTKGITVHIGVKEHGMFIEPHVLGLEENTLMDQGEDTVGQGVDHQQPPPDDDDILQEPINAMKNSEFVGEFRDPNNDILLNDSNIQPSGEGKNSTENHNQLETGTGGERFVVYDTDDDDDEMIDIAAKREAFLSSQCTLSQDFMATFGSTEICVCMKCNKGGNLLVCSSDACPFRVHQSCLGSGATFDEHGNFFCPFCAYSHAISKYLEVKKKASLAREELQVFLSSGIKHIRKMSSKKGAMLGINESREMGLIVEKYNVNGNDDVTSRGKEDCAPDDSFHEPRHQSSKPKPQSNKTESPVSNVSSHSNRSCKRDLQCASPKLTLARRKKLQWTKTEEETLTEGVRRFSSANSNKGIPWKAILEFGRDVFDKSRTTIDLKDKWRNISKGNPATKKPKL